MSLFRSAMSSLLGKDSGGGTAGDAHPLLGTILEISGRKMRVKTQIAQGGFAYVFSVQEQSGGWYALKYQLANDQQAAAAIAKEVNMLRKLSHAHILRFLEVVTSSHPSRQNTTEFLILTELCSGGSAMDLLSAGVPLTIPQILNITYSTASALAYLHSLPNPITHRDIKVENILFDGAGVVKLCDFGSATTESYQPLEEWNALRRTQLEEEYQRHTTPMYRAPEILDTYQHYPVGPQQDVWALGCVLYYLCYGSHPFEDSAKLRIMYAKYSLPVDDDKFAIFHDPIRGTLIPDPRVRLTSQSILDGLNALAIASDINVKTPVPGVNPYHLTGGEQPRIPPSLGISQPPSARPSASPAPSPLPSRPPPPRAPEAAPADISSNASAAFSSIKGQSISIFKNFKEKSAAVVQTVQNTYGSRGPEVIWITGKVLIAPQAEGVPEALAAQSEETLRNTLQGTRRPFVLINLSQRRLRCDYVERPWERSLPPNESGAFPAVDDLLAACRVIAQFLRQSSNNSFVAILGTERSCCLLSLCLLLYHRMLPRPYCAEQLLAERRTTPTLLPPSHHRLLDLVHQHTQSNFSKDWQDVSLEGVTLDSLPLFNHSRSGCRPFVEVFANGARLSSSYSSYHELANLEFGESFTVSLGRQLAQGDICIAFYHARHNSFTNRYQQVWMFSLGFHTALLNSSSTVLYFHKGDLDFAPDNVSLIPEDIRVGVGLRIATVPLPSPLPALLSYNADIAAPRHLTESKKELDEIQGKFGQGPPATTVSQQGPPATTVSQQQPPNRSSPLTVKPENREAHETKEKEVPPPRPPPANGFFDTLSWGVPAEPAPPPLPPHSHQLVEEPREPERTASLLQESERETPILGTHYAPCPIVPQTDLLGLSSSQEPGSRENPDLLGLSQQRPDVPKSTQESDLLGLSFHDSSADNSSTAAHQSTSFFAVEEDLLVDPFSGSSYTQNTASELDLFANASPIQPISTSSTSLHKNPDLLTDLMGSTSIGQLHMSRNASAPSFPPREDKNPTVTSSVADPFADFLASAPDTLRGSPTPAADASRRPNYNRAFFEHPKPGTAKGSTTVNAFDDILQSQGFKSSQQNSNVSLATMRRADEIADLTPSQIKIRDWTAGKERNIRALLASLNDVLWEGADRWNQPTMASLLSAAQVKKSYRMACLVVHPDKQTGLPHEDLAKAIFTELNDAWNAFEESGSPSL